jgi:glycerol-3-phosphate dehydrogenase (NAD+)
VAIVGSGSWGTALAKIAAENVAARSGPDGDFEPTVNMWVREKQVRAFGRMQDARNLPLIVFLFFFLAATAFLF